MSQLVATREREFAQRLVFGAAPADLGRVLATVTAIMLLIAVVSTLPSVLRAMRIDLRRVASE